MNEMMSTKDYVLGRSKNAVATLYEMAVIVRNEVQEVVDAERESHIASLRSTIDAGRSAEKELATLRPPGRPVKKTREPRKRKGESVAHGEAKVAT